MLLAVAPDILHRIKFRCVGGKKLQLDSPVLSGDLLPDRSAAVSWPSVPDDQQAAGDVALEMVEKLDELRSFDASREESEIKVPDGDARNSGKAFPIEGVLQNRGLSARRPCAHAMGAFAQAAFVDKDYCSLLLAGFFFISGQRTFFHRWMAGSSRWVARPTGR